MFNTDEYLAILNYPIFVGNILCRIIGKKIKYSISNLNFRSIFVLNSYLIE